MRYLQLSLCCDAYSLDKPDENGITLEEKLADDKNLEERVAASMLLKELLEKLRSLDPEADKIIQLWEENPKISAREIARQLGRKQRTFADQITKYREIFKNIRSK